MSTKALIDCSGEKCIFVKLNDSLIPGLIRIDNISKDDGNNKREITITISVNKLKVKGVDGIITDF